MARVILKEEAGMFWTNGKDYGRQIHLAEGLDGKDFYKITEEEYNKILEEKTAEEEA